MEVIDKFEGHKFSRHESDKSKFGRGKLRDTLDSGGDGGGPGTMPPTKITGAFSLVKSVSPAGFRPQKFGTLEALQCKI